MSTASDQLDQLYFPALTVPIGINPRPPSLSLKTKERPSKALIDKEITMSVPKESHEGLDSLAAS